LTNLGQPLEIANTTATAQTSDEKYMSDIKLFQTHGNVVSELAGGAVSLEKSLQTLFELNLENLLGVRFLASEFVITEGRIDTLGVDENNCPVVIEYKRSSNENVINQGLFYLDWLMGHRKDFEWLVLEQLGAEAAKIVDWSGSRLICIAGDFGKYDEHAVKQMNRNIALIRYRKFNGELLLLEQLTAASAKPIAISATTSSSGSLNFGKGKYKTTTEHIAEASPEVLELYESVKAYLEAIGDDIQVKMNDNYVAFRRLKNFACVELRNQAKKLLVYVKVKPESIQLEAGFTRDVRSIGHFGTGDLEITIQSSADIEKAKPLFEQSYQAS
jgi:predicted transport protein